MQLVQVVFLFCLVLFDAGDGAGGFHEIDGRSSGSEPTTRGHQGVGRTERMSCANWSSGPCRRSC